MPWNIIRAIGLHGVGHGVDKAICDLIGRGIERVADRDDDIGAIRAACTTDSGCDVGDQHVVIVANAVAKRDTATGR